MCDFTASFIVLYNYRPHLVTFQTHPFITLSIIMKYKLRKTKKVRNVVKVRQNAAQLASWRDQQLNACEKFYALRCPGNLLANDCGKNSYGFLVSYAGIYNVMEAWRAKCYGCNKYVRDNICELGMIFIGRAKNY